VKSQLQSGKRVLVITVFTAGPDSNSTLKASLRSFLNVEARREEDCSAMRELGVDYHHLGLQEALIRHGGGRSWLWGPLEVAWIWVVGCLRPDRQLQQQLVGELERVVARTQCPWLIGPAAIGFHPDHLLVHRACVEVGRQVPMLWHYYDFPYSTYSALAWARRWALDVQWPLQEVEAELSPEQVAARKRLIGTYESQVEVVFGSREKLEATLDSSPNEHFLELRRSSKEDDRSVLPLPSVARRSKDSAVGILKRILIIDFVFSLLALYWVRHGLDWSDSNVHAMRFAYAVISLSALRVVCLAGETSVTVTWWLCVSSILLTAAAFSYTAEVRSIALATYYSLQMWLGCAEQSVASFLRRQRPPKDTGPLRVLVVSDYMPPQTHGISTHTSGLVSALRQRGCFVHVYTTCGAEDGLTYRTWSIRNPWNPDVRLSLFPSFRLLKTIFTGHWEVVHVVFPNFLPWPVMTAAWLAGVPVYASQHCDLERLGRVYTGPVLFYIAQFAYWLVSYLPIYLFATLHAGPTEGYINSHPVMRNFAPERLAVVPSSLDAGLFHSRGRDQDRRELLARLGLEEGRTLWLMVSRLAPEKDIQEILLALKFHREHWPQEQPEPILVVAGDGPLRGELENMAEKERLPVHFLGFVQLRDVARLYRACDVCATNSVHETFGLTVIESLASGCPMVMPHCAVFDELYAETLGDWMYTKGDVESLTRALRAASRPAAREELDRLRREDGFSRRLFWSWAEAAEEQVVQYRQAQEMVQARKLRFGSILRTVLMVISLLTLLTVCIVSAISAGSAVHQFLRLEGGELLRRTSRPR